MKGFQMPRIEIELTDDELERLNHVLELYQSNLKDWIMKKVMYEESGISILFPTGLYDDLYDDDFSIEKIDFENPLRAYEATPNPFETDPELAKFHFMQMTQNLKTKQATEEMFQTFLEELKKDDDVPIFYRQYFEVFLKKIYQIPESEYPISHRRIKEIQNESVFDESIMLNLPFLFLGSSFSFWEEDEKQMKKEIISEHAQNTVNKRHATNRQRKATAIEHFKQEQAKIGISKNQFAQKYADKYCITEKTLREWLKNCN